jgi:hypothetical protein
MKVPVICQACGLQKDGNVYFEAIELKDGYHSRTLEDALSDLKKNKILSH